ncbi:hypothetical protein BKA70DRAFT_1427794 [Coprinopsis sp. MPI-PUGE-AT-0042]|nr:hypothetical protein BKA70DRAFT_1427794 [Coprinopsis sp. MPI-PUGE-AT-0042]
MDPEPLIIESSGNSINQIIHFEPLQSQPTATSPQTVIRHIPAEILATIIHWAIGGPGLSKLWRDTAFSSPQLWRYLSVEVKWPQDDNLWPAILKLGGLISRWFKRGGHGANVHLDLGGWMNDENSDDTYVGWERAVWGPDEIPYKLTTVRLWGDAAVASSIPTLHPSMPNLRSLSIHTDSGWRIKESSVDPRAKLTSLESLGLKGPVGHTPFSNASAIPTSAIHACARFSFHFLSWNKKISPWI